MQETKQTIGNKTTCNCRKQVAARQAIHNWRADWGLTDWLLFWREGLGGNIQSCQCAMQRVWSCSGWNDVPFLVCVRSVRPLSNNFQEKRTGSCLKLPMGNTKGFIELLHINLFYYLNERWVLLWWRIVKYWHWDRHALVSAKITGSIQVLLHVQAHIVVEIMY